MSTKHKTLFSCEHGVIEQRQDGVVLVGARDPHGLAASLWMEVERARAANAEDMDAEQARWQRGIEEVLAKYGKVPDAGGCDSGDPLDYTLSQLDMFLGVEREVAAERAAAQQAQP